jgi:hypothetical protein
VSRLSDLVEFLVGSRVIRSMADKLVVVEDRSVYRIQWELDDGDDMGAFLGQERREPPADYNKASKMDRDYWAAERAGFQVIKEGDRDTRGHDAIGFWWESKTQAAKAFTKIRALMKSSLSEIPWPDWAVQASAAGWKPPKGWKP